MLDSAPLPSLDLTTLARLYQGGDLSPRQVLTGILHRIAAYPERAVWIHRVPQEALLAQADAVQNRRAGGEALPLYGIPFAIKDMIDVAGLPTSAGCPAYSYTGKRTAPVVSRLLKAGAILVGKTNLDQFATGLAGDRTPYGACSNVFDAAYISGGSSSGSAVAVAAGLVSFALGTDTAGSGRVPAGCNNIVGLKPTPGLLSTEGVVPACQSLDCVSIFALTVEDAWTVCQIACEEAGPDATSLLAPRTERPPPPRSGSAGADPAAVMDLQGCTFLTPRDEDLEFFGDQSQAELYRQAQQRFQELGARRVSVDFGPFREVASLLYDGPWVAERLAAVGDFLKDHGSEMHPVTRAILEGASRYCAVDVFKAQYRLKALRETCMKLLGQGEMLLVPTLPTIPTLAQVQADSLGWSRRLGFYTNFVNLLGLAALVLPSGFTRHGLPASVTLIGPGGSERRLCELGMAWQRHMNLPLGATGRPLPGRNGAVPWPGAAAACKPATGYVRLEVAGAHLRGQPLHQELLQTGARFVRSCRTAARYRFVALLGLDPPRPGLLRADEGGGAVLVEVYDLPVAGFGSLVASLAPPLAIGTIELEDGEAVKGFLCESWAAARARDITACGGWAAFRAQAQAFPCSTNLSKPGQRRRQRAPGKENG